MHTSANCLCAPRHVLKASVVVGDVSERGFLQSLLESCMQNFKVHINGMEQQSLIRARLKGTAMCKSWGHQSSKAHCKYRIGCLKFLLVRMKHESSASCWSAQWSQFQVHGSSDMTYGRLNWKQSFTYMLRNFPKKNGQKERGLDSSFRTLAIDYFQEITVWNVRMANFKGENLEITFRIWQWAVLGKWSCFYRLEMCFRRHILYVSRWHRARWQ